MPGAPAWVIKHLAALPQAAVSTKYLHSKLPMFLTSIGEAAQEILLVEQREASASRLAE